MEPEKAYPPSDVPPAYSESLPQASGSEQPAHYHPPPPPQPPPQAYPSGPYPGQYYGQPQYYNPVQQMITPAVPTQPVVVIQQARPPPAPLRPGERAGWASESAQRCAVLQLICGIISIILGIAGAASAASLGMIGMGITAGVFFTISGSLGVAVGKEKKTGMIAAHMAFSILSSLICLPLLVIESIGAALEEDKHCSSNYFLIWSFSKTCDQPELGGHQFIHAILIIIALFEAIVSIISAALCCRATCCGSSPVGGQVFYTAQTQQVQMIPTVNTIQYVTPGNTGHFATTNMVTTTHFQRRY